MINTGGYRNGGVKMNGGKVGVVLDPEYQISLFSDFLDEFET